MTKTAIVILNYNGEKMLKEFLPSVIAFSEGEGNEVIVADNASTDGSLEVLRTEFPQVRTIVLTQNWGFAEGYNKALSEVEAQYYVLLNSDVMVSDGWISPVIAYMDAHEDVSAVQPKLLKYKRQPQETTTLPPTASPCSSEGRGEWKSAKTSAISGNNKTNYNSPLLSEGLGEAVHSFEYAGASGGFVDCWGYPYCRGRIFGVVEQDEKQYDEPMDIHWATGACMFVRAEDYWEAGGLDGRFFAHNEEIDLCWRLRIMGKRIVCLPESHVFHLGGGTLPQGNPRKTYLNFRNNLTMIYKNAPAKRLNTMLRMRTLLDWVAIFQSVATGNMADAKAIIKARNDFKTWRKDFVADREKIQSLRTLAPSHDTTPLSILWQYYVHGRKKWSMLPTVAS